MFLTFEFWMSVCTLLIIGFIGRKCGVAVRLLLALLLVGSFWLIYSASCFSFFVLISFFIFCVVLDGVPLPKYLKIFMQVLFLVVIKWLFIGNHIESLPLGISFLVFQSISFSLDRENIEGLHSSLHRAGHLFMFPQVFAGPIIKYQQFIGQLNNLFVFNEQRFVLGGSMILLGLIYKEMFAGSVTPSVDMLFEDISGKSLLDVYLGGILFGLQIYGDFVGYSLLALGLCRIIGFTFPDNFFFPYFSTSVSEFWRRWHISLGRFFHEYVYIPLQKNLGLGRKTATFIVFCCSGVWHGIGLNFLVWGAYHAFFVLLERSINVTVSLGRVGSWIYVCNVVIIGWVLFRLESISDLQDVILAFNVDESLIWEASKGVVFLMLLELIHYALVYRQGNLNYVLLPMLFCLSLGSVLLGEQSSAFIYFQF